MNEFALLIKDNVLDKEQLVLKRSEFLNIGKVQILFLSKLFTKKDLNFSRLTLKEVADNMSISNQAAESLTKELVVKGLVKIKSKDGEFKFNFNTLINKLIESYIAPNNSSNQDEKLNWAIKTISFKLTTSNIEDLKLIIKENGWENLKIAITKLISMEGQTWHQLISMYESLGVKESTDINELKLILNKNWLEN